MALRIAWATQQHNVKLAIAANIFVQAGTILLYVVNLVFAQRIIRAQHPRLGWHRALSVLARLLILAILLTLVLLIFSVVQSSYTLDPNTHHIDRDIQLYGTTFYAFVAFLPIPMVIIGLIIPRRIRTEKFGQGRFRYKIAILILSTALMTIRGVFGAGVAWKPMIPLQAPEHPWYYSKLAFYCFDFIPEVLVVALYAIVRVDRRFYVPSGQRGSYMVAPSEYAGVFNVYQNPELAESEVLKVYSEEELFEDSATLADTLRYSQTSLMLDSASGKWALKRLSAQSLYSRDSMITTREGRTPSRLSERDVGSSVAEERDGAWQSLTGNARHESMGLSVVDGTETLTPSGLSARGSAMSTWSYV